MQNLQKLSFNFLYKITFENIVVFSKIKSLIKHNVILEGAPVIYKISMILCKKWLI